jgi:hypothetical protein
MLLSYLEEALLSGLNSLTKQLRGIQLQRSA